jgi:hypothetical protein
MEATCRRVEASVKRPNRKAVERGRGQQVDVDPAEALPHQLTGLYELQNLAMSEKLRVRQDREEPQDFSPSPERPASELADHEGMRPHLTTTQTIRQDVIATAEVVHPDGRVDEH